MVCLIDNYDSFTFNIVQYLADLGVDALVLKNDVRGAEETLCRRGIGRIIISPGPCSPDESGISPDVLRAFAGKIPILGVCLGHEVIGQVFGAKVVRARRVMHGKVSQIHHTGEGVFAGLPNPFLATRYHSLVVARDDLPPTLEVTAWTQDADGEVDEIMGLRHRDFAIEGVQFHPEAVLTEHGHDLLRNFLGRAIGGLGLVRDSQMPERRTRMAKRPEGVLE